MLFSRINLHHELQKEKERHRLHEEALLKKCRSILQIEEERDKMIQDRIAGTVGTVNEIHFDHLPNANIFTIQDIAKICGRYRLRFLETKHLRYPLPYEAFIRIKEFEKQQHVEIKQFSIMAPAEAFKLQKKTDPLLFAHLGNNRFYLIHQWGNDLSWKRKALMLPLRNLYTLVTTIILISFALAFFLPKEWIVSDESLYPLMYNFRLFLFFVLSTGSMAASVYIGITRNKNFSEDGWNSKWI